MKLITILTIVIASLIGSVYAEPKDTKFKIAEINFSEIYSAIGSQRLSMLDVNPEIKAEIAKLKEKQERLLIEVVKEDDEVKLAMLQSAQQVIQNKMSTINSILSRTRSSSDYRYQIREYVSKNYSDEFQIIMDSNMRSSTSNQLIVSPSVTTQDITRRVIEDMQKVLP